MWMKKVSKEEISRINHKRNYLSTERKVGVDDEDYVHYMSYIANKDDHAFAWNKFITRQEQKLSHDSGRVTKIENISAKLLYFLTVSIFSSTAEDNSRCAEIIQFV